MRGWDPDPDVLRVAEEREAVEARRASPTPSRVPTSCSSRRRWPSCRTPCGEVLELAPPGAVVTDVGSTKSAVCAAAAGDGRFVGGHPICGAETRGPERANAELFDGATWFLTPTAGTGRRSCSARCTASSRRSARGPSRSTPARTTASSPSRATSHTRSRTSSSTRPAPRASTGTIRSQAAGGSLRDMTRIAGANPRIWVDIFLDNRDAVAAALAEHRQSDRAARGRARAEDGGQLARWIAEAAGNRRRLLATAHGDPGALQRLRVHLPDRPGVLAGIFQALGAERINVEDFEMDHLSTDRGGTLSIVVGGEEEAERAATLLEAQGYGVVAAPVIDE